MPDFLPDFLDEGLARAPREGGWRSAEEEVPGLTGDGAEVREDDPERGEVDSFAREDELEERVDEPDGREDEPAGRDDERE